MNIRGNYQHVLRVQNLSIWTMYVSGQSWQHNMLTAPNFQQRCTRLSKYEIRKNLEKMFPDLCYLFTWKVTYSVCVIWVCKELGVWNGVVFVMWVCKELGVWNGVVCVIWVCKELGVWNGVLYSVCVIWVCKELGVWNGVYGVCVM